MLASGPASGEQGRRQQGSTVIDTALAIAIVVFLIGLEIVLIARKLRARRDWSRANGGARARASEMPAAEMAATPVPATPVASFATQAPANRAPATDVASFAVQAPADVAPPRPFALPSPGIAVGAQRIVASPPTVAPVAPARPVSSDAPHVGGGRRRRRIGSAALAVALVAGVILVAWSVIPRPSTTGGVLGATGAPVEGSAGGSGSPGSVAVPSASPRIPTAAASALRLTVTVDDRLAASAAKLRAASTGSSDPVKIAVILRSIAADASWGLDVLSRLGEWPAAADLRETLRRYYASVVATARDGLSATITSASAYRTAAKRMLTLTERLPQLRAGSVALAAASGIALPAP